LATLALFRRIGEAVDAVCARFGALRMNTGETYLQIGWFSSQGTSRGGPSELGLVNPLLCARALFGAAELGHRATAVVEEMQIGIRVKVGLAHGSVVVAVAG